MRFGKPPSVERKANHFQNPTPEQTKKRIQELTKRLKEEAEGTKEYARIERCINNLNDSLVKK